MEITINDVDESFDSWLNKDFVTKELRETLGKADILLVPFENLRDTPNPFLFPVGTEEVLRYFNENLPTNVLVDICISDNEYQEFAFYSNYKRLGNFIVKSIAVPVFVTIFSTFVYDKYLKEDNTKPQIEIVDKSTNTTANNHISNLSDKKYLEPTHIKFSVTIVDSTGKSKNISFEGPATGIDTVMKSLKEYEE